MMGPRSCSSTPIYRCVLGCALALLLGCSDCSGGERRWPKRDPVRLLKKHALPRDLQGDRSPPGFEEDSMTGLPGGFLDSTRRKSGGLTQRSWMEELASQDMNLKQEKFPLLEPLLFQNKSTTREGVGRARLRPRTLRDAPPAERDADILLSSRSVWGSGSRVTLWSWWRGNNCANWYGVTCDRATGVVISLDLPLNTLTGPLPSQWSALRNLTRLGLSGNAFTGSLPSEWSALTNLAFLDLWGNSVSGSIPSHWTALLNLQYLGLSKNALNGSLPSQWSALTSLTFLDLSFNTLTGSLPSQWSALRSLRRLDLSRNSFNGSLPSEWSALTNLTFLNLWSSSLSGSIPSQWSALLNQQHLDLSWNGLNGSLPSEWAALSNLTRLDLSWNDFNGSLPSQWSALTNLVFLDLGKNSLSGSIPGQWTALRNLAGLFLLHNQLSGTIPSGLGRIRTLRDILIAFNYFAGDHDLPCRSWVEGNCLFSKNCSQEQRPPSVCEAFCNATSPVGTCGGRGVCALAGANSLPTCTCDQGFVTDPFNLGNCILRNNTPSPPPPPPRGNLTLGLSFLAVAPRRFLNRYSRYISFRFRLRNSVPVWNIETAVPWMAPPLLFPSATDGHSSGDGIINWTSVQNQGGCSSCWAEAAADSVASSLVIARNPRGGLVPHLSVPQILKCTNNSGGCEGDLPTNALDYVVRGGLVDDNAYSVNGTCPAKEQAWGGGFPQVLFYEAVQFRGWMGLLLTVQNQPAIITLEGSSPAFQQPRCHELNFILSDPSCYSGRLDHSVLVVGYELFASHPFWVIRNSWGTEWCTQGYMRLAIQGGDGTCGMNVLPAYYPVPAPRAGDPCFRNALSEDNSTPVMNPCGGGRCNPETHIDPYSYNCTCPNGFVAANNSVDLAFPVTRTQSCIPVDACGLSFYNPCKVGTCVNDGLGEYSCICPLGYTSGKFVDGSPTCVFLSSTTPRAANYTVGGLGVTCALIGASYNLTQSQLERQNPGLNCNSLQIGTIVNVSNPSYQCAVAYINTVNNRTCQQVLSNTVGNKGISLEALGNLNIALNCSNNASNIQKGQLVCLKGGSWPEEFVCTDFHTVDARTDTCLNIAERYEKLKVDPVQFYKFNPGIDCEALIYALRRAEYPGAEQVCVGSEPVGAGNPCMRASCIPAGYPYTLKKARTPGGTGETCPDLFMKQRGGFRTAKDIEDYNNQCKPSSEPRFNCATAAPGTRLCTKKKV